MISDVVENIVGELKKDGADFFTMLPCKKVKRLYDPISEQFEHGEQYR